MIRSFVVYLVYLLLEFVITTMFIQGSSLTLPAVREVSPLNFELFEAELTLYLDRVKQTLSFKGFEEALDLVAINP